MKKKHFLGVNSLNPFCTLDCFKCAVKMFFFSNMASIKRINLFPELKTQSPGPNQKKTFLGVNSLNTFCKLDRFKDIKGPLFCHQPNTMKRYIIRNLSLCIVLLSFEVTFCHQRPYF